ncbi:MAG: MarR family transcriptional regulator [Microbacterium sp.]|uniref:MarR family winged helix-turn-helix transcriptional regulator n=1 Tax=Microbacterium sp. TaxID=51671 RepID=UPI0026016889|nr:MarR family transcriptional regulator [Microbacterium sp.]MCX6503049.1 MarR family transcriptional regulator [Microbacterium sp.]
MSSSRAAATEKVAASGPERLWETHVGSDLAFLLARANARSLAGAHAALAPFGLKARSYSVLALAASDARPTQRELSDFLRLDPSQIVALIDDLAARGLVRREPDPADRRVKVVVATVKGRALHEEAYRGAEQAEIETFAGLTDEQRDRFTVLLRGLAADVL